MGESEFTIELHHGKKFIDTGGGLEYLGGFVVEDLYYELDEWSLQEIGLGYKGYAKLWWNEPEMDLKVGLTELKSDRNAINMGRALVADPVKHGIVYAVDGYREGNGVEITSTDPDYIPNEGEDSGLIEVEVDSESEPSTEEDRFDDSADDGEHEDYFGFNVEDGVDGGQSNTFGGFNGPLNQEGTTDKAPAPNTLAAEFGSTTVSPLTGSGSANDSPLAGSGAPATGAAVNPPHTLATQPTPFIEPLIQPTPQVAPVTQPLPKTRTFGMRRSQRLKMGITKGAAKSA
ncbi:hypothetical protein Ahy_A04g018044 [Arachis hypogaea]|uniref:PB1-like domain-containing protein n=1 Tax=Arachis hypogaea TaxID=3818 RepID=A0A445DCQ4_ARAHY|nr:hypothetical protein Ahy_A04g018044 [Arachis hypogaea]